MEKEKIESGFKDSNLGAIGLRERLDSESKKRVRQEMKEKKENGLNMKINTKEELQEKVDQYFQDCLKNQKVSTAPGLALFLGVSRNTLTNYNYNPRYFEIIESALTKIESSLLDHGLSNKANAMLVKYILSATHGYREKMEVERTETNNNNVTINIIAPSPASIIDSSSFIGSGNIVVSDLINFEPVESFDK